MHASQNSENLGVATVLQAVSAEIISQVQSLGGNDSDILHMLYLPASERQALIHRMAREVARQIVLAKEGSFDVDVDYSLSIKEMRALAAKRILEVARRQPYIAGDISDKYLISAPQKGPDKIRMRLFEAKSRDNLDKVLKEIAEAEGLRPAVMMEFLAFISKYPTKSYWNSVVVLGSKRKRLFGDYVPVMRAGSGLSLREKKHHWDPKRWKYAVVEI